MLNELKDELEYCRRKWALARAKNTETQSQWNDLRSEFSKRKLQDANNSGESGYSDEPVSDDDNSDNESAKNIPAVGSESASTSKKLIRMHSVSPIRNETLKKRDTSAPPIATFSAQVFQTTSEIVPANLTLEASVVTKPVENLDLNYAAKSTVVEPKTATKITVKNVSCERPSTSSNSGVKNVSCVRPPTSSNRGARPKSVDEVRPRLSRELRKKVTKTTEKRKGEETLEEMFFRLSGQEPPAPEPSANDESDDEDLEEEVEDIDEVKSNEATLVEPDVLQMSNALVTDESFDVEDISNVILSEEDEERRLRRAARFQRLEEQCQQLITQVINNSTRGDELNLHLDNVQRRFTPLREGSKSIDKSDEEGAAGCSTETVRKDETECLSQKEQEYTSRRAERLKRLEEECKEFLNKQNKSKIRANEMSNKLDKLHQRYGSQESSEPDASVISENKEVVLTEEEEAYTARRAERLKRLEEQSAELLEKMAQSSDRAKNIESSLDVLHSKFGEKDVPETSTDSQFVEDEILDVADITLASDNPLLFESNSGAIQSSSIEILEDQIITESGNDVVGETTSNEAD